MIFEFWQPKPVQTATPEEENTHILQQISSGFQQMAMSIEKAVSLASQSTFTDKLKAQGTIVGLEKAAPTQPAADPHNEDERLLQQTALMQKTLKTFNLAVEQHANHVSCRMHDFRGYMSAEKKAEGLDQDAIYLRAADCVNETLGDLIILKEQTREKISQLTLHDKDVSRLFNFFDGLDRVYGDLTAEMQNKLRLLKASLTS